jgi:hypothetical protein
MKEKENPELEVDFIDSRHLTKEQEKLISDYFKAEKAKKKKSLKKAA